MEGSIRVVGIFKEKNWNKPMIVYIYIYISILRPNVFINFSMFVRSSTERLISEFS